MSAHSCDRESAAPYHERELQIHTINFTAAHLIRSQIGSHTGTSKGTFFTVFLVFSRLSKDRWTDTFSNRVPGGSVYIVVIHEASRCVPVVPALPAA